MRIRLRTGGNFGKYMPSGGQPNPEEVDVAEGASVVAAMKQLGFPDGTYMVSVNGAVLNKAAREETFLAQGDELAILPPLRGG